MENATKQSIYSITQDVAPTRQNQRKMLDEQNFFTYGRILDESSSYSGQSLAIGAFSDRFQDNELVDISHVVLSGTYFGLNLPEGSYELLVFADQDRNGVWDQSEVVGKQLIRLDGVSYANKVTDRIDISLSGRVRTDRTVHIPVPDTLQRSESVFFPSGSIRDLNDPLFDPAMATLGMYDPAAFLEDAPTMFYALEEDSYKAPVVFVHGISGSAREFASIVSELDEERYKPWFFYYPSGGDLDQLSDFFYRIFLSGQAVQGDSRPLIIVAHSMGGLIVREALNRYRNDGTENKVGLFISMASPFGGHPSAAKGAENGPLVVPSWLDLNPESPFIRELFRKPLPSGVRHHLFFSYGNPNQVKLGENSDGVVPLSSQLRPIAQSQAAEQFGFDSSHGGILRDPDPIRMAIRSIDSVSPAIPKSHLSGIMEGGFDVEMDSRYSEQEKHYIRTMGRYLSLLADGTLDTLADPVLEHFVEAAQGRTEATTATEMAWLKFSRDYPEYAW